MRWPTRAFGGMLNDPAERLRYYRDVLASAERDVLPGLPAACEWSVACPEAR